MKLNSMEGNMCCIKTVRMRIKRFLPSSGFPYFRAEPRLKYLCVHKVGNHPCILWRQLLKFGDFRHKNIEIRSSGLTYLSNMTDINRKSSCRAFDFTP